MRIVINESKLFKELIENNYSITLSDKPIGITIDSRLCQKNDIYIPIVGQSFDGHDFINEVSKKKPVLIISEKDVEIDSPILKVDDNREFIRKIVRKWKNQLNHNIVGITGSNGKTTTKDLAHHVISSYVECFKTDKNFNTILSSPLSFLSTKQSQNIALIEMGTNQSGEIKSICDVFEPNIGLITNISNAHAENFNSILDIANEKGELLTSLKENGIALINVDDPFISTLKTKAKKVTYGFSKNADFYGKQIDSKLISINGMKVRLPYSGIPMAQNSLAVFALASVLGVPKQNIIERISSFELSKGRGQIINLKEISIIDDTYNANPVSMIAGLKRLIDRKAKRKIAILGDMFELGELEKESHENIGTFLLNAPIDIIISTGNCMKYTQNILKNTPHAFWFNTKDEIIEFLNSNKEKEDLLYLKGSRGMKMEKIIKGLN